MYRKILVPLDGSTFAEHALPIAAGIARRAGAELYLALVHEPLAPGVGQASSTVRYRGEEQAYLDGAVARLARSAGLEAEANLLDGSVAETLTEHAEAIGADLVVMTSHGRGPFERFLFGEVADSLVRHAPMPVLLARPDDRPPDLARDAHFRNVMIALDGSELAEDILAPATDLAALMKARVRLVRVVEPMPALVLDAVGFVGPVTEADAAAEADAHRYLAEAARQLRNRRIEVSERTLVRPSPADAILEEAQTDPCDLIALATHGRGGLSRVLLGSVADRVARGADCCVLIHKATK